MAPSFAVSLQPDVVTTPSGDECHPLAQCLVFCSAQTDSCAHLLPRRVGETATLDLNADRGDLPTINAMEAFLAVLLKLPKMSFLHVLFPWRSELDVDQCF